MAVRYLFNTEGDYVAFVQGANVFAPDADWIGFVRNGNEFYRRDGTFAGYILDDDRVARKRNDSPRRRLPRPFKPFKPFKPFRPLKRLRMPKLPWPYEDVFLAGVEGVSPDALGREITLDDLEGAKLYAADDTYLGKISRNQFDNEALANQFGPYGNPFNANSVFNEFGPYGNPFSLLSPRNEFTRTPPRIVVRGETLAYLTANSLISPRVDPTSFFAWLKSG
jgi:hypothetical protein